MRLVTEYAYYDQGHHAKCQYLPLVLHHDDGTTVWLCTKCGSAGDVKR